MFTRRNFLKSSAAAAATLFPPPLLHAAIATLSPSSESISTLLSDGWEYLQGSLGGPWEVWHSEETAVWTSVAMPHSFNAYDGCDPDIPYYRGNGWYRTHITLANPYANGRTLLHFEGAGQTASVYIGERLAGKHTGGYDEFVVDITEFVTEKNHTALSVLVDNSRDLERMPSDISDFSLYGGLYRHVNLVYVPEVSLSQFHIRTHMASPTGAADVALLGRFYAPKSSAEANLTMEVTDPRGIVVHHSTKTLKPTETTVEFANFSVAKPRLWHPRTPQLYTATVTVTTADGTYTARETFGLKHTQIVEQGPFLLNGERLLLRGTHRHEDHAGYANAMPDELIEREMILIKSMGANFIRLAHYQQSRQVLELCDRLGILVWEEVPWCRGGIGDNVFQQMGRDMLRNMITQHFNHPSILFWGLGNEDDWPTEYPDLNEEKIRAYMSELNTLAHELDPSRYTSFRRCDFARDIPDVYSPSIWAGWYRGVYTEYQKSLENERGRVKHLIHIEYGADSHAGRHSENPDRVSSEIKTGHGTDERGLDYLSTGGEPRVSRDGDWSETYACNLFDWHLKTQEALPWFIGAAQWVFKDFTTPLRVENPVPRINQKGLVTRDMTKKEAFYVFQSYWSDEPMAHIYGHNWPVRWGTTDEQKMVKVYSNCDTAELFVNGVSAGVKQRDSQNFPAAGLRWTPTFIAGANHLKVVAKKKGKTVSDEIDFLYQTEPWSKPAKLELKEKSRTGDRVIVEGKLYDEHNVLCLDAKNVVRFSLAGEGSLVDNLGTPTGSRLVQLYNGRAEITVLRHNGPLTAAVASTGFTTALCTIA